MAWPWQKVQAPVLRYRRVWQWDRSRKGTASVLQIWIYKETEEINSFSRLYNSSWPRPPQVWSIEITLRHTVIIRIGRNPLDERSARRRDLYLTTHNTHNRRASMTPAGFKPAIPASERPQTHTLHRETAGIVRKLNIEIIMMGTVQRPSGEEIPYHRNILK